MLLYLQIWQFNFFYLPRTFLSLDAASSQVMLNRKAFRSSDGDNITVFIYAVPSYTANCLSKPRRLFPSRFVLHIQYRMWVTAVAEIGICLLIGVSPTVKGWTYYTGVN